MKTASYKTCIRLTMLALIALVAIGCVNYRERADLAYQKGSWDEAAINYERALDDASEPAEIKAIKPLLEESRMRASAEHHTLAESLLRTRNYAGARGELEAALRFQTTRELEDLHRRLDREEGADRLRAGRTAYHAGEWDEAISALERAQELAPTAEGASLLSQARAEAKLYHENAFNQLTADAREALERREWSQASSLYAAAHEHGSSAVTRNEADFCQSMVTAEAEVTAQNYPSAESHFQNALAHGIDQAYVQGRMLQTLPRQYRITVHSAVILPFQPQSHYPWDGPPRSRMRGANQFIGQLTALSGPQGYLASKATELVLQWGAIGTQAPDCFLLLNLDGQIIGGLPTTDPEDLLPSWNLAIRGIANSEDRRVLGIQIRDQDLSEHDNVGDCQFTIGDLVSEPGVHEMALFDSTGLSAGGILVLKLSIVPE